MQFDAAFQRIASDCTTVPLARWPALRLKANKDECTNRKKCTQNCPMSLDVNEMVQAGAMEHSECILCATCIDVCPKDVIRYSFSAGVK